jgi:hypothetical protein
LCKEEYSLGQRMSEQAVRKAVGKYKYEAKALDQLSFEKGDKLDILIYKPTGKWWFAEKNGKRGWVPFNYVTLQEQAPTSQAGGASSKPKAAAKPKPKEEEEEEDEEEEEEEDGIEVAAGPRHSSFARNQPQQRFKAIAKAQYKARQADQLSFAKGDVIDILVYKPEGKWWYGKLNDKKGWVPFNYVDLQTSPNPASPSKPSPSPSKPSPAASKPERKAAENTHDDEEEENDEGQGDEYDDEQDNKTNKTAKSGASKQSQKPKENPRTNGNIKTTAPPKSETQKKQEVNIASKVSGGKGEKTTEVKPKEDVHQKSKKAAASSVKPTSFRAKNGDTREDAKQGTSYRDAVIPKDDSKSTTPDFGAEDERNPEDAIVQIQVKIPGGKRIKLKTEMTASLRDIYNALSDAGKIKEDQEFVFLYQGKPVFREFWDVFEAVDLQRGLESMEGSFTVEWIVQ